MDDISTGDSDLQPELHGAGRPREPSVSLIVDAVLGKSITISPQSTSVKPFEPIIFNVTNPTSGGSYQANFDIGNGTVITVPVIVISSSQLAVTAPAGAYSGTGASLALSSGTVKIAIGWTSGSGGYSYSDPMPISIAALPTIPSTMQTGAATIALLKAMKLLYLQADGKLLGALGNVSSGATALVTAVASQRASIRSTLAGLDSLQQLISQAVASPSGVSWATINGVQITMTSTEVAFLDQISAGQIQAIEDAAAQSASSSAQFIGSGTLQRASFAQLGLGQPALGMPKARGIAAPRAGGSLLDFDVTAIAQDLAQNARTIASTVGNVVGVVAGTAAAIAVVAGATAAAPALVVVAATGFMVSTGLGTAIGAALDVGAEAIAQGSAAVTSLTASAEFLANQYVSLAETTVVSSAVTQTMGPAAGNLAGAVDNAYQIMTSSTSPAAQNAESNNQIGSSPTDMPDTFTVQQTATVNPASGGDTVTITTTPATSTSVTVDIDSSDGEQEVVVPVTNGSATFQIPESDLPVSGEDTVIQTLTDGLDDVAGSLDLSSVNTDNSALDPEDSDLDSTELPNPDLLDSVQAIYGTSSGGGSGGSGTVIGNYTITYEDTYNSREFTDSGTFTATINSIGTPIVGVVTALTVTSVDGLFPGGLSANPSYAGYYKEAAGTNGGFTFEAVSPNGTSSWGCGNSASDVSGSAGGNSIDSEGYYILTVSGTCTVTTP